MGSADGRSFGRRRRRRPADADDAPPRRRPLDFDAALKTLLRLLR